MLPLRIARALVPVASRAILFAAGAAYSGAGLVRASSAASSSAPSPPPSSLDATLRRLAGRRVFRERSDGNCFFRALARQLFNDPEAHARARAEVYRYMEAHADDFAPWLEVDFAAYLRAQRVAGAWGGEHEMRAASRLYDRQLYAYQPGGGGGEHQDLMVTVHRPRAEGVPWARADSVPKPNVEDIALLFEGGNHWNSAVAV